MCYATKLYPSARSLYYMYPPQIRPTSFSWPLCLVELQSILVLLCLFISKATLGDQKSASRGCAPAPCLIYCGNAWSRFVQNLVGYIIGVFPSTLLRVALCTGCADDTTCTRCFPHEQIPKDGTVHHDMSYINCFIFIFFDIQYFWKQTIFTHPLGFAIRLRFINSSDVLFNSMWGILSPTKM